MAEPLASQRHLFDIPDDVVFLNCSFFSPKPRQVLEAGRRAVDSQAQPWHVRPPHFFDSPDLLRQEFATLIGGDADGVAFVPSVSYGVGTAARNLIVGPGRTVLLIDEQFSSDVYPWRTKVAEEGGSIVTVPRPANGDFSSAVLDAIDTDTAVVSVPQCHWADGAVFDLEAIGAAARAVGAALVIDLSQSLGAAPFDVAEVQPDFLITVGYKWLFGPFSYGYMWVAPQHRNGVPLESTWTGRKGSEDFSRLVDYTDEYQHGARRFDVGEFSNFTLVPMALAALGYVNELGPERIAATLAPLTTRLEDGCRELGLDPVPAARRRDHMLGVRFPHGLPDGLYDRLAAESIFVSIRGSAVRVAPNVYNTSEDIDRLLVAFAAVLGRST